MSSGRKWPTRRPEDASLLVKLNPNWNNALPTGVLPSSSGDAAEQQALSILNEKLGDMQSRVRNEWQPQGEALVPNLEKAHKKVHWSFKVATAFKVCSSLVGLIGSILATAGFGSYDESSLNKSALILLGTATTVICGIGIAICNLIGKIKKIFVSRNLNEELASAGMTLDRISRDFKNEVKSSVEQIYSLGSESVSQVIETQLVNARGMLKNEKTKPLKGVYEMGCCCNNTVVDSRNSAINSVCSILKSLERVQKNGGKDCHTSGQGELTELGRNFKQALDLLAALLLAKHAVEGMKSVNGNTCGNAIYGLWRALLLAVGSAFRILYATTVKQILMWIKSMFGGLNLLVVPSVFATIWDLAKFVIYAVRLYQARKNRSKTNMSASIDILKDAVKRVEDNVMAVPNHYC